jgi:hypothetical protein
MYAAVVVDVLYIYAAVVVRFHINIFIYLFSKMHYRGGWCWNRPYK